MQRAPPEVVANYLRKISLVALIIVLLMLAAMGKLDWLFALVGVGIAFIVRMLPALLRYAPFLQRLWFMSKSGQQGNGNGQDHRSATNNGQMTVDQAYQVLGLKPGVTRQEIIAAHKRLMMKVHPDKGGSDFLAAQLNRAKEVLLKS